MHRRPLLEMLGRYREVHPGEHACVDRIASLVEAYPDCFLRTCLPGHITAAAWIVDAEGERFLLTHHRKLDKWLQLGGHADGDGDVLQVALREAREESGIERFEVLGTAELPLDVDVHPIPARGSEPEHLHLDIRFLLRAEPGQELVVSGESRELRWFRMAELERVVGEESVLRMGRKARGMV